MLFFIPSNPEYGGRNYQIAKGHIDAGESTEKAACREAEEELGLKQNNIKSIELSSRDSLEGMTDIYTLDTYIILVKEMDNKLNYSNETSNVAWLTMDEFNKTGRNSQKKDSQ